MAHPSKPQAAAAPDKKRSTKGSSSSNRNKSPMARIRGRSSGGEKKYEGRKAPSAPQRESSKAYYP